MKRFVAMLLAAVLLCSVLPLLTSCGSSGGSAQSSKEDAIIGEWTVYVDNNMTVWAFSKDGKVVWEEYKAENKNASYSMNYHWSESSGDTLLFIDFDKRPFFYVWCSELESTFGKYEQREKLANKYYSKYSESVNGYEYDGMAYIYDGMFEIGYGGSDYGLDGGFAFSAEKINKVTSTGPVGTFVRGSGEYVTFNADGTGILAYHWDRPNEFVYTYDETTGIVHAYRTESDKRYGEDYEDSPYKIEGNFIYSIKRGIRDRWIRI